MKTKLLRLFAAACSLAALLTAEQAQAQQTDPDPGGVIPPTIISQPVDQTVDYGMDVSFSVVGSGTPLYYQWQKNGTDLADYSNVSGAKTATLTLVGVAQSDAGDYTVVISNSGGAVTSVVATLTIKSTTVFSDDFESGDLRNWTVLSGAMPLTNSAGQNHTANGSQSALVSSSGDRMYHNLDVKLPGRVRATFWLYDDGGSQTRYFGELRGYTGHGYGTYVSPGGMRQLLAIGRYGIDFGTNNTGTLVGEEMDPARYQGRVYRGKSRGWFNLDAPGAPERSVGWHEFVIDRAADGTNVDFYVDGILGRRVTGADYMLLNCVVIGSVGMGSAPGNVWVDDVKVESFPRFFDWQSLDSGGVGLFDWMRLRETGTNVGISQVSTVFQAQGRAANGAIGRWVVQDQGVSALDVRGAVDYSVTAPADDAYRIEVQARGNSGRNRTKELPLLVSIDGEYLGRFILPCALPTDGFVHCFTPFIKAGPHTVRVAWDNAATRCSLNVKAVRLQSLIGPAVSGAGRQAWVETRLRAQNGVEVAPASSPVSPVCLEGRGQYLGMMRMLTGSEEPLLPIQAEPGPGHRWYANIPLSPDRPTRVEVSYQNGGLKETNEIVWEVTNLLKARDMWIRRGDALLLTAVPDGVVSGAVKITVVGVTDYTTDALTPVVHRFDQAGTYRLVGAYSDGTRKASGIITVTVVEASLDSPAAWVGKRRYWDCTNLPPEVVLDWDPRLQLKEFPAPPELGAYAREYSLITDEAEPRYVVARLGHGGPVLASTPVQGFRLFTCANTYLRLVQREADGSQLVETSFVMSPVLPSVTVGLKVLVSGVTFDDGTVSRTLTASDFDALGQCRVRFIRAAGVKTSVCHTTKAYQGDVLIGWPTVEK